METVASTPFRATHHYAGYDFCPGNPLPFGATPLVGGVNFSIYSMNATHCTLVLFERDQPTPLVEIPIPREFRIGRVWTIVVLNLDYENIEYGFRMDGPHDPPAGHRYDPDAILLDPYAKSIGGRDVWGLQPDWTNRFQHRARIVNTTRFDWETDRPLARPIEDCIIYEMHVRGFTMHPTAGVQFPGTYDAIREKIPYLRHLGVNTVELMPIFEFDEFENSRTHPQTGETLLNYWGYAPVGFFAPKAGYAASGVHGGEMHELKTLIKALHANDIEVILDVVFNHTAEGNELGPVISFKGIDNRIYYILTPEGYYYNFSGTGNTFNCNHPLTREMIIDCLRYWVAEYHVDGFRFDLASIMTRDVDGMPLADPPLLREMAFDPILGSTKLIAEPWDADGLYHLGSFPAYGRWAEWNGKFRDTMRCFLKGDAGMVGAAAQAVQGSPDLYPGRGPIASINFITSHDGFTLMDLVSYNNKYNDDNCEPGDNGMNDNNSWNHGAEGPTADPEINTLRHRQVKNAVAMLMLSQGVPMLLMGDEAGRSQRGNNNAYCQDNEVSWFNWRDIDHNRDIFEFVRGMIAFRRRHAVLRNGYFFTGQNHQHGDFADISFHGTKLNKPNWTARGRVLAFLLDGKHGKGGLAPGATLFVILNMHWESRTFEVPPPPPGMAWYVAINTGHTSRQIFEQGSEPRLESQETYRTIGRSVAVLILRQG